MHSRLVVVAHSIVDLIYQHRWRRAGLVGVFNRLFLLSPDTLVASVYRRTQDGLKLELHTLWDAHFKPQFEAYLNSFIHHTDAKGVTRLRDRLQLASGRAVPQSKFCIRLFDLPYEIVLHTSQTVPGDPWTAVFVPVRNDSGAGHRVLKAIDLTHDITAAHIGKQNVGTQALMVGRALDDLKAGMERREKTSNPDEIKYPTGYSPSGKLIVKAWDEVTTCIGRIYMRCADTPMLRQPGSELTNVLLWGRRFTRRHGEPSRCGVYHYDVMPIISEAQGGAIVAAIRKRAETLIERSLSLAAMSAGQPGVVAAEKNFRELVHKLSGEDSAAAQLVEALRAPSQDCVRSLVEHCISSGFFNNRSYTERRSSAQTAGHYPPNRMGPSSIRDPEIDDDAHARAELRNAVLRHVLFLMCPRDDVPVDVIQIPIRVGGAPAFSVTSVRPRSLANSVAAGDGSFSDADFWFTYHMNHSVEHFIRSTRTELRQAYLDLIKETWAEALSAAFFQALVEQTAIRIDSLAETLNSKWFDLSRIFSFQRVEASAELLTTEYKRSSLAVTILLPTGTKKGCAVHISLVDNDFFDMYGPTDEPYLKIEHLRNALQSQTRETMLEVERWLAGMAAQPMKRND